MKIELHLHTDEVSPCGKVPAQEMVRLYHAAGYQTLVFTDHLFPGLKTLAEGETPAEKAQLWLRGYHLAKEEGDRLGMNVLLGCEARLESYGNEDFLVFGLKEEDVEWMFEMLGSVSTVAEMSEKIRSRGLFLVQAHPFRPGLRAQEQSLLDGVEAFNGNPRHNSSNHLAKAHAMAGNLVMISGSDAHQLPDIGRGGLNTDKTVSTNADLLALLRGGSLRSEQVFDSLAITSEPVLS